MNPMIQQAQRIERLSNILRQLESVVREARQEIPSARNMLGRIHRGDLIRSVFSNFLLCSIWACGVLAIFAWLLRWGLLFHELERWLLVVSFFDQILILVVISLLVYQTSIRAEHLKAVPPGRFVSLQAAGLLLRWLGEFQLIFAGGYLAHALLGVSVAGSSALGPDMESLALSVSKIVTIPMAAASLFGAFWIFLLLYALAGAIDAVLSIEQNTRGKEHDPSAGRREITGTGQAF